MNGKIIYSWSEDRDLSRWFLEGDGEIKITPEGHFEIDTYELTRDWRNTTCWLRNLELPENFEIEYKYSTKAKQGNSMVIFNAHPVGLSDLFADKREHAMYVDIASNGNIVAYTIGYHRSVYNLPSVLRKIGGRVPDLPDEMKTAVQWKEMGNTVLQVALEQLTPDDIGKSHLFKVIKKDDLITFSINGKVIHNYMDEGKCSYYPETLKYGKMGFRKFHGPTADIFESIIIREI